MEIRPGTAADADPIAALHTASWQTAYAGIMPGAYLDGPLPDEHLALWRARLSRPPGGDTCLLVAGDGDGLAGFAYLCLRPDGRVLLDNLHVRPALKRSGIGSLLVRRACGWVAADHPGRVLFLEVLRDNAPARAFYERMGGVPGKEFVEKAAGGVELDVVEYTWDPSVLAAVRGA
ncbi:GNAT family N-acetyltransferase [Nonomuraea muscovyensis]|uniref:GNAT family N-acetyltransferase n=1 Tax=Nonomuraea muscovyensis TaxID=1124761 RepID=UPI0033D78BC7